MSGSYNECGEAERAISQPSPRGDGGPPPHTHKQPITTGQWLMSHPALKSITQPSGCRELASQIVKHGLICITLENSSFILYYVGLSWVSHCLNVCLKHSKCFGVHNEVRLNNHNQQSGWFNLSFLIILISLMLLFQQWHRPGGKKREKNNNKKKLRTCSMILNTSLAKIQTQLYLWEGWGNSLVYSKMCEITLRPGSAVYSTSSHLLTENTHTQKEMEKKPC